MKFFTILTVLSASALAAAAPCTHESHHGHNSNYEDNSVHVNKENTQAIGGVANKGSNSGLLSGLLGETHILSHEETNNIVTQKGENH